MALTYLCVVLALLLLHDLTGWSEGKGGDMKKLDNPTYKQVCSADTGHAEVLKVVYDPSKTSYEKLCRLFFEIHDFTQTNGQGPDIGDQYRSEIFYTDENQKTTARNLLTELSNLGYKPATALSPAAPFWKAEEYHQDYYGKNGKSPYCHARRKVFPVGDDAAAGG